MRRFLIGDRSFEEESNEFQAILPRAYEQGLRPHCQCKEPPVPMYIAQLEGQHFVKRMPLSGRDHDPACPSYDPPYELSGLGPLIGNAIQVDANGRANLKIDFSMTKKGPRAAAPQSAGASERAIRNEPQKLSLRAMLHYLWEMGELTEWRSSWAGKRGWGRVRTSLMNAASQMTTRGGLLSDMLFVPETFRQKDKEAIAARRATALAGAQASGTGPRKLMIMVAEVKEFIPARVGHRITLRHLPFPLMLEHETWKRLNAKYETELELWRSNDELHLVMIATFGISASGVAAVAELAMMVVNGNWIPFENVHERHLLERLGALRRKSVKGLRFNLPQEQPIVSVTLPEERPSPVAMFIIPAGASGDYQLALAEMIEARPEMTPWIWCIAEGDMPKLP
ncbi:DUF1173 domain-containing protein [Ensifer adhaerens]|uniref:DUF1173 domain-containing protein n=1 Tax=Ensifer adhaerens TaxID=106592 RepID=UPI001CBED5B6|nr:DUF1173 domain-containing protein [Ensifer adhaerens]MBZ7925812.1 DUF1173 domain-containing protein [Ensifer adhaerens]UAX95022.1 DUF1173 domain-containing protein [Ensifer adhaerens]UAY03087.1 DUF1173 domain-containing protein [Ensifer adhaerens]UAY11072.1 DUF1173 domain-containing protein [Ensifer adhaerens]